MVQGEKEAGVFVESSKLEGAPAEHKKDKTQFCVYFQNRGKFDKAQIFETLNYSCERCLAPKW